MRKLSLDIEELEQRIAPSGLQGYEGQPGNQGGGQGGNGNPGNNNNNNPVPNGAQPQPNG